MTLDTLRAFSEQLHQRPEQVLPLRLRRRLSQPDHLHVVFWAFRKHYKHADMTETAEIQIRSPEIPGHRADAPANQGTDRRPGPRVLRRHLLLDGLPAERPDDDVLRPRLHPCPVSDRVTNLWFDLFGLLPVFLSVGGLVFLVKKCSGKRRDLRSGSRSSVFAVLAYLRYQRLSPRSTCSSPRGSSISIRSSSSS